MRLIKSRGLLDSAVACFAMIADVDFDTAHRLFGRNVLKPYKKDPPPEVMFDELQWVLFCSGIPAYLYHPNGELEQGTVGAARLSGALSLPHPVDIECRLETDTAIIATPRRMRRVVEREYTTQTVMHFIVSHRGKVFDPVGTFDEMPPHIASALFVRPVINSSQMPKRSAIFNHKMVEFTELWKFTDRPAPSYAGRRYRGIVGQPVEEKRPPPPNAKYPWPLMNVGDCVEILLDPKQSKQTVNTISSSISMYSRRRGKRFVTQRGANLLNELVLFVWRVF